MRLNSGTVNSSTLAGLTLLSIVGGLQSSQVQASQASLDRTAVSETAASQVQAAQSILSWTASAAIATSQIQNLDSQSSRAFLTQIATEQAQGSQLLSSLSVLWSSFAEQVQSSSGDSQREVLAYVEVPRFQSGVSNGFALGGAGLNAGAVYPANIRPVSQIQSSSAIASLMLVSPGVESQQIQTAVADIERHVSCICQGFTVQSAVGVFSRAVLADWASDQVQSNSVTVWLLSGEPSIYHADVALQDFIAIVPLQEHTVNVPFIQYEAVV